MEAAYAPFNWTQDDDSNGAVKIEGTNQHANGYDVQIAKKIAQRNGQGASRCENFERTGFQPQPLVKWYKCWYEPNCRTEKEIAFSNSYYTQWACYAGSKKTALRQCAKTLKDFKDAKITSQQGVLHLISQLPGAGQETNMGDGLNAPSLESGVIDGYISERPKALTAEAANSKFKMIQFKEGF